MHDRLNHAEREKQLLDKLYLRVNFLTKLKKKIYELPVEALPEMASVSIERIWEEVLSTLPENVKETYSKYINAKEKLDQCYTEIMYSDSNDDDLEIANLQEEVKKLSNDFVSFLNTIKKLLRLIENKAIKVAELGEDKKEIIKVLKGDHGLSVKASEIKNIIRKAAEIILVVETKAFSRLFDKEMSPRGVHIPDSPFSFIRSGIKDEQSTIKHESTHNLADGAIMCKDPRGFFERIIRMARRETEPELIESISSPSEINSYIDQLHGEIVADLEKAEEQTRLGRKKNSLIDIVAEDKEFSISTGSFGAAGYYARKFDKLIEEEIKKEKNKTVKYAMINLKKNFKIKFKQIVSHIETSLAIGDCLSEEARNEVENLLFILKPSQYHHIVTYLKHRYGEEKVTKVATTFEQLNFFHGTKEEVKQLANQLDAGLLEQGIIRKIDIERIADLDYGSFIERGVCTIEEYREYQRNFQTIYRHIQKMVDEHVSDISSFVCDFLDGDLLNNWANVPELYAKLTTNERKQFKRALTIVIESGFQVRLITEGIIPDTDDNPCPELKKLPLWNVLRQLDLDNFFEKEYEREFTPN